MKLINYQILRIEELSLNSWPAINEIYYDGWILRLANGFTDRCNSVWPLFDSNLALKEKIAKCESVYSNHKQPSIFRVTSDDSHAQLDNYLSDSGYVVKTPTLVQTANIEEITSWSDHGQVEINNEPDDHWLKDVHDLIKFSDPKSTYPLILRKIIWPLGLAKIENESQLIALGLGVVEDEFIGLYGMQTHTEHRRRGWAGKLLFALIQWGKSTGANSAYLHVEENNVPARTLYDKIGFRTIYKYWYRVKPTK